MAATATTLPGVLASGPALHALVRVELTNGTVVVGRLLEMDGATMNMKLDAIASTAVRRRATRGADGSSGSRAGLSGKVDDAAGALARAPEDTLEPSPVALRCIQGMVVRGACVRFVDFIREGKDGGTSYGEVETAAQQVRPSE